MKELKINKDLLKEIFDYHNGKLIWKASSGRVKTGDYAGSKNHTKYVQIRIKGRLFSAHRLVYMWHYGDINDGLQIDHINCNKQDNRIENLRLVTNQENSFNRIDVKGYSWSNQIHKYIARIGINGKLKHLGTFDKKEDARKAYLKAKKGSFIISADLL